MHILNSKNAVFPFTHYTIHFLMRYLVALFIAITPVSNSLALWIIVFAMQILFVLMSILRLYSKWYINVMNVLIEIQILCAVTFMFALEFIDQSNDKDQVDTNFIFEVVYLVYLGLIMLYCILVFFSVCIYKFFTCILQ